MILLSGSVLNFQPTAIELLALRGCTIGFLTMFGKLRFNFEQLTMAQEFQTILLVQRCFRELPGIQQLTIDKHRLEIIESLMVLLRPRLGLLIDQILI